MRQYGIIDYMNSKKKKRFPPWSNRLKDFIQFCSKSELKTDEELNNASLELLKIEHEEMYHLIMTYIKNLSQEKLPGTVHTVFGGIRSWLEINRYGMDPVEFKELKAAMPRNVIVTDDEFLTREKIQSILAQCDAQIRAFVLIACSSGARLGEIMALDNDSIKYWEDEDVYYFKVSYRQAKNGKPHKYFVSHEAYDALCEHLKNWQQYQNRRIYRTSKTFKQKIEADNKIFQLSVQGLRNKLNKALEKAGLLEVDSNSNRNTIHPHSFRKFADTTFKEVLGVNMGNELIGHDEGLSESYRRYDPRKVAEAYRKVEPYVTIQVPADYVEIKHKVSTDVAQIQTTLAAQSVEMQQIKEQLKRTEELMAMTMISKK